MGLLDIARRKIVLFDGAMGTMCHRMGLPASTPPEWFNLSHPEIVKGIHRSYARAGAKVLTTNTLGGNRIKLSEWNIAEKWKEINAVGVRLAKQAAGKRRYVAASIGSTGRLIEPLGDISFEDAYDTFTQQARIAQKEGADLILIETMSDLQEARAAVIAARSSCELPILVSFTFEATGRTLNGDSPEAVAVVMEGLRVDGIGINCVDDLDLLLDMVLRMAETTHLPILAKPNAGRPELVSGEASFGLKPEKLAAHAEKLIENGANFIGGCCGTTPEHVGALAGAISGRIPRRRRKRGRTRFASRSTVVEVGTYPCVIGELINPSGRKELKEDLRERQTSVSKRLAVAQSAAGAELLDVNVAVPMVDEPSSMERVVKAISASVETPLVIDSSNIESIERGLRAFPGKAVVNSTTGEEKRLRALLPLAKKYGAALIGLTMDDDGIPSTAEGCLKIAGRIADFARKAEFEKTDLIIDPLVLSAGVKPERVGETLRAVALVKKRLRLPTVLGISNVSYGLPKRGSLNAAFLTMAIEAGVDMVIVDPLDRQISESLDAVSILTGRGTVQQVTPKEVAEDSLSLREQLRGSILIGDPERASSVAMELLESESPQELLDSVVLPVLEEVGERFSCRDTYLPQLILSSDAAKRAIVPIRKKMEQTKTKFQSKGKLLFATVRGDLHDIGKNIVIAVLENYGYDIVDLGKDVPGERILEAAQKERVDLICLSSLMTTTMDEMARLAQEVSRKHLSFKVLVGGAVVTEDYAASIGVSYARDAQEAVKVVGELVREK